MGHQKIAIVADSGHGVDQGCAVEIVNAGFESASSLNPLRLAEASTPMLAPRERECLHWVAAGLSSKRIAHKLGLSLHTVNEFIGNAMRKLDATTRAEAAAKAIAAKLIDP